MKRKSNMVLKSANFRKHVKICLVFLTLFTILNITALFLALFFQFKKPKELTANEIFKNNINSIVEIKSFSENVGESFGTAEFINDEGMLVTNAHVVTYKSLNIINTFNKHSIRFATDEEFIEVSLIKYNIEKDIAILQMNPSAHKFSHMKTANSSKIETGDKVYAIGNTANYGISMSQGIVGVPLINIDYNGTTKSVIQCSITIAEGNSGGALVNDNDKTTVTQDIISYELAVWGLRLGLNTYCKDGLRARQAAFDAGNGIEPRFHSRHELDRYGNMKKGIYFDYYHTHKNAVAYDALGFEINSGHAFFGEATFNV